MKYANIQDLLIDWSTNLKDNAYMTAFICISILSKLLIKQHMKVLYLPKQNYVLQKQDFRLQSVYNYAVYVFNSYYYAAFINMPIVTNPGKMETAEL